MPARNTCASWVNSPLFDHTNEGTTQFAVRLTASVNERYGLAKSIAVAPGDKIKAEVFAKFVDTDNNNWTTTLNDLVTAISSGTTAPGTVVDGSSYGTPAGTTIPFAGQLVRQNDTGTGPKAYLNWLVFDKSFEVIASKSGFRRLSNVPKESGADVPHEKLEMPEVTIEEAGYVYIYFSNENETFVEVYFDDFSVTHTPTNIVQYNEYYPFGLQTANSWSREEVMPNAFLYNGGSELNSVTNNYEMFFREYDPTLGRMNAIDPMASKYASLSPYNYAFNDPVTLNDPSGADPAYQRSDDTWWAGPRSGWGKWSYGGPGAFANEQRLLAMERSSVAMYMSGGDFSSGSGYFGKLGLSHSPTIVFGFNSVGEAGYWVDSNSGTHTGLNTDNGTIYLQGDVVISTRFVKIDNDSQQNQGGGPTIGFDNYANSLYTINAALGFAGVGVAYQGDFWKTNELYHLQKNGKVRFRTDKLWNNNFVKQSRLGSLKATSGLRTASNYLAGASLVLTGINVATNSQVNPSDLVNATMAGISFTGVGSLVAGAYFLVDFGLDVTTGQGLGERLDAYVGQPLVDW